MKGLSKKVATGSRGIFLLMVAGVILFWILGEVFLPGEGVREEGRCQMLSDGWVRVMPDGKDIPVRVPGTCPADALESVSIETALPGDLQEDTWLCTMGNWQELELLVDQVVRRRYSAESSRIFGKNNPSAYIFLKLSREDAGKVLRITSVSNSSYSGVLGVVYIGDRMGILTQLMKRHGGGLMLALFLLVLSGLSILLSVILRRFYHKEIVLEYLAWGTFLTSLWLTAGSKMRQFLFPNISVASSLSFLAAMLALFPLLIYMDSVQKQRYQKGYVMLELLVIGDFAACTFLQVTNQLEFMESVSSICLLAVLSFLYILFCIYRDFRKKRLGRYPLVALGMVLFVVSAAAELTAASLEHRDDGGVILCIGLVCFLVLAIVENIRKLFYIEREKQRAVLANESKGKFLANMSHEIRTPINTIIGMNEMILRENQDAGIQEYAQNISGASKTLLSLVNDVLDFSKMESGNFEVAHSSYYVSSLLNDVIHVLRARTEKKHLDIRLNVDEGLPSILVGDEVRIRKMINTLFNNSLKFTREGVITFSAQGEWTDEGEFYLSFSIADTGTGIPEEDLKKINAGFAGLDEDWSSVAGVHGDSLGLGFLKQFIVQMHGEIRVQSVYGSGTMSTIRIPQDVKDAEPIGDLQEAYAREQRELAKPRQFLKAPEAHVLSVDDNDMNLAVVRGLLKRTEIQLDTVADGKECMIYTRRKKYDLIFMDHMMPDPDGISTFHQIRQEADNPNADTPIVALTANAVAGSREEYLNEGFDDYLSKPIVVEKLEQMLQKYLPEEKVFFQKEEVARQSGPDWEEILKDMPRENTMGQKAAEPSSKVPVEQEAFIVKEAGLPYCGNDADMYLEFLQAYYEQGQEYVKKLLSFHEEGDWQNYGIIAHAVKSTSMTIGAVGISEQAKQQELAAKEHNLEELEEHWKPFYQNYKAALREAAHMLEIEDFEIEERVQAEAQMQAEERTQAEAQEQAEGEAPQKEYMEGCRILLEQIRGYEMGEALEQVDKLLSMQKEKTLEQVRGFINDFEYDRAESCLLEWMEKWEVGSE